MQTLKPTTSLICLLVTSISAMVAENPRPGVLFCRDIGQAKPCLYMSCPADKCLDMPTGWNDQVSSLRPDAHCGICTYYQDSSCKGGSFSSWTSDLEDAPPGWNDKISSFKCFG
ncbi:hypothetical protein J3459_003991 [Metarhizium acridum]|nr:hypothetical protein J3459_003991 [Metarhizium acridum]